MYVCMHACMYVSISSDGIVVHLCDVRVAHKVCSACPDVRACLRSRNQESRRTAILTIIEGQFQVFQRFSSSKLILQTVESCFGALNYHENAGSDSITMCHEYIYIYI
jgi:hypothetical protein